MDYKKLVELSVSFFSFYKMFKSLNEERDALIAESNFYY